MSKADGAFGFKFKAKRSNEWNANVTDVIGGSPADRAGLRAQDVIFMVNDKAVADFDHEGEILQIVNCSDTLKLRIKTKSYNLPCSILNTPY